MLLKIPLVIILERSGDQEWRRKILKRKNKNRIRYDKKWRRLQGTQPPGGESDVHRRSNKIVIMTTHLTLHIVIDMMGVKVILGDGMTKIELITGQSCLPDAINTRVDIVIFR